MIYKIALFLSFVMVSSFFGGCDRTLPGVIWPTWSGFLDPLFGVGGRMTTDFGGQDIASAVTIDADGMIVVAGNSGTTSYDFALARYQHTGELDPSFGAGGTVTTDFGFGTDVANSIAIQPDGKIVVAGAASNAVDLDFAVARYNVDGSLDSNFGTNGLVTTDFGIGDDLGQLGAVREDGKILLVGLVWNGSYYGFGMARYNADGSPDLSFGTAGSVVTNAGTAYDLADTFTFSTYWGQLQYFGVQMAVQSDGKVVVVGTSVYLGKYYLALVRYNADGSLDTSFGAAGKVTTALGLHDWAFSVAIQEDQKIVVGGTSVDLERDYFVVARYNPDGTLDQSFGRNGVAKTNFGWSDIFNAAMTVVVQDDGRIVVAGTTGSTPDLDLAVARYNSNGSLDLFFNIDGRAVVPIEEDSGDFGLALAIQQNGAVVVVGTSAYMFEWNFVLTRFLP